MQLFWHPSDTHKAITNGVWKTCETTVKKHSLLQDFAAGDYQESKEK